MKKFNVVIGTVIGTVILVVWGVVNEYIHVLFNDFRSMLFTLAYPTLEQLYFTNSRFNAIVWITAITMMAAAVAITHMEDVKKYANNRTR